MKVRRTARRAAALALVLGLCGVALGDVIRMKDGQVIRGQIVGFRDQQFTVMIGSGARGRRSQLTLNVEDVESIEFEPAGGAGDDAGSAPRTQQQPAQRPAEPRQAGGGAAQSPAAGAAQRNTPAGGTGSQPASGPAPAAGESPFFPVRVRVRADNTANGWTDSGLVLRKGQRLRITASGRVSLGQGRFSTPEGLPRVLDNEKLMRNEPTGALIAVVGDDNDEFIFIGPGRTLSAPRDGRLFLGLNEGNLNDNTGTYDVLIEVEPAASGRD